MREVRLIIGLPGSGKTALAEQLHQVHGGALFDDVNNIENRDLVFSETTANTIIMADPHLCRANPTRIIDALKGWFGHDIRLVSYMFEPDIEQSMRNVESRNDGRVISRHTINQMSRGYDIDQLSRGLARYGTSVILPTYRPISET